MKNSVKKLAAEGLLLAAASIVFLIESLIPPLLPVAPYVKIGLANVFVLLVIVRFGVRDAFLFVLVKICSRRSWCRSRFCSIWRAASARLPSWRDCTMCFRIG